MSTNDLILDTFNGQAQAATASAVSNIDEDPEKATRAMELGQAFGVSPTVVYGDLDNFERQSKTAVTAGIVGQNPHLQTYIGANPMAAKVSSDDYGQLDAASSSMTKAGGQSILGAAWKGFKDNFDAKGLGEENQRLADYLAKNPAFANIFIRHAALAGATTLEGGMRLISGVIGGAAAGAGQAYVSSGGNEAQGARLTRDLIQMAQVAAPELVHGIGTEAVPITSTADRTLAPYISDGKVPPPGVHPIIDAVHQAQAEVDKANLSEALKESVASATRERSPELFRDFAAQHVGEQHIGISADAVRALYGDKLPEPDDGLLGWVPRIQEQLETAATTGADVQVPLADYLAKVEPDVHKAIEDGIRFRPEGMTPEEAKEPIQYPTEMDLLHGFSEFADEKTGDFNFKPLSQVSNENRYDAGGGVFGNYTYLDSTGKWLKGEQGALGHNQAVRVKANFKNLYTVTPDTVEKLWSDIGGRKEGPEIAQALHDKGYDGLYVKGFDDYMHAHDFDSYNLDYPMELAQDQVVSFEPDKNLAVSKRDLLPSLDSPFFGGKDKAEAYWKERHRIINEETQSFIQNQVRRVAGIKDLQPTPESTERAKQLDLALPDTTPLDTREEFAKANAIGMTVDQYRRYQALIEKRAAEDADAASARALADERKRQTTEWKDNRAKLRPEIVDEVTSRPEHELDEMLREGRVKLRSDFLTPEDKAVLPKEWYAAEGIHPDDLAGLFGTDTGRGVVDQLRQLVEQRDASGMKPDQFRRRVIDAETDREMEVRYGNLDRNIIEQAKEQVLSETQQQLLHEETLALASQAGLEFSITKEGLEGAIRQAFEKTLVRQVDSDRFLTEAGKAGRAAEMALLKADPAEAFRMKQRQYHAFVAGRLAKQFEKVQAQFERNAKRFSAREVPSVDQEYTNWIHDILLRNGRGIKRSIQDLQDSLARGASGKTLEEFVDYKQGHDLREVPVAEFLLDPAFRSKTVEDLSVADYRALNDSIKTLIENGRDERKITKAGEEADLADVKSKMIDQLRTFPEKEYDARGGRKLGPLPARPSGYLRSYFAASLQLETLFNRWDRGDPRGVFNQYVTRELASAANYEAALEREFATKLRGLKDKIDLKERVDNPIFRDPLSSTGATIPMTRENLRAVMLNVGNASNFDKLARGYDVPKETILEWLHTNAVKEDWDFAQKVWDLFAEIKAKSDVMYRGLSGIEPENIPAEPILTPHGEYKGGYYPVIYDPVREGASKKLMGENALEDNNYVRATVPAGYTKSRTGYAAPMALHMDMLPFRIRSMLHDIAMRPAVIQASKIFYDKDIRAAITSHYGAEYKDLLVPYLKAVANNVNVRSAVQSTGARFSEFMRQNMITTLVGLNPGTVMKHGPTAWVNSMTEVGPGKFLNAVTSLLSKEESTGESNWQFAMQHSEELQRRHRNWTQTLGGAQDDLVPQGKFMTLRQTLIRVASTPVAWSDLVSAVPTWLAKYEDSMSAGSTHGDAVYDADRAVRRAHGSTVITNRPEIMRGGPAMQWLTSLYGFFNHIMNRQVELVWKAGDTLGLAKQGDFASAAKNIPELTSMLVSYVLFPAMVEEAVTSLPDKHHEGWLTKAAKALTFTAASSWIGVRDLVSGILSGRDPSAGLLSTLLKTGSDTARDFSKDRPMSKQHAGNVIKHGATAIGAVTGMANSQEGRTSKFIYEYATGQTHPRTLPDWYRGLRFGTIKER